MLITKRQEDIIVGLLLGDGHLEKNGRYVRLRIDQGLSHKDYIEWLYGELINLVPSWPRIIREMDKRAKKVYSRLHFSTYSSIEFMRWWKIFYFEKRKIIPPEIGDMLKSNLSVAIWLMDDGYKRNDCAAIRLNTDAFNLSEQRLLIQCLWENFKIKSHLHKKGKWFNIYIPKREAEKFNVYVKPYVLPSFKHKLL